MQKRRKFKPQFDRSVTPKSILEQVQGTHHPRKKKSTDADKSFQENLENSGNFFGQTRDTLVCAWNDITIFLMNMETDISIKDKDL